MYRIGTSGWSYDHWQGIVYPHGTPDRLRLDYYLPRYSTVEVNSSYYHWPRDATFANWRERLPEGFRMTVKAPRALTHVRKLTAPEEWVDRIAAGVAKLGDRLGLLLVQLPPRFRCNLDRLEQFLALVPGWIPLALEFRDASWHQEPVFAALERRGAAYCVMSGAHLPCVLRATAPAVYVRFHGPDPNHLYGGSYSEDDLCWWSDRFREWEGQGRDVWAYFNNDREGNAVRNADRLRELLDA